MTSLLAVFDLLPDAVITVLKADQSLAAAVGNRIYDTTFPSGTGWPFVIAEFEGDISNDSPRPDVVFEATVWCYSTNAAKATAMADAVASLLHLRHEVIAVAGWNVYWCALKRVMRDSYVIDNQQYWTRKLIFEMRVDKVVD